MTLGKPVDSISKLLTCDFISPIAVGSTVFIKYQVAEVGHKSYTLKFEVLETETNKLCVECRLVSVFYDPILRKSILPPQPLVDKLVDKSRHGREN